MKRILVVGVFISLLTFSSLPATSSFQILRKYIMTSRLLAGFGGLFDGERNFDNDYPGEAINNYKDIAKIIIESIRISILPIPRALRNNDGSPRVIGDFFDPEKFRDFLIKVACDLTDNKFEQCNFATYIRLLRESLDMPKIRRILGSNDAHNLRETLLKAENYYCAIPGFQDEFTLPDFSVDPLKNYFNVDCLVIELNNILRGNQITKLAFIDCFDFRPFLISNEFEGQLDTANDAIKGMISLLISLIEGKEFETLLCYAAAGFQKVREHERERNTVPVLPI